ncbi:unnamed protein product [Symbiodinium sp. CCMP2456]|nr:unnamed protein product [Symbiodinium sp. CCMP2456]
MVAAIGRCLVIWLLVGLAVAELRHGGRALKEKDKDDKKKKQQAVKQLKEQVAQLTQEKNTLSDEVKSNARDASAKARQIAELTAQVSQQQSTIASLRAEVAKKQPSAAAGNAEMEAKRLEKLTAEASRQQQEIASLTSQLSALKIKHETLQQEYGDPSLRYFLASKATKVYGDPGIQGAANKTFKYVLPHIAEALKTSTEVYAALNESLLAADDVCLPRLWHDLLPGRPDALLRARMGLQAPGAPACDLFLSVLHFRIGGRFRRRDAAGSAEGALRA